MTNTHTFKQNKNRVSTLNISGGGFAISGLCGATIQVLKSDYQFEVISGISSGSIIAFIVATSKDPIKVLTENATNININSIFKKSPFSKKGKLNIRGIYNLLTKPFLAKQDNLENTLSKLISKEEYNKYLSNPHSKDCIIISVDFLTGRRKKFNLKDYSYEDALKIVNSSSSIPVFTDPKDFEGGVLYDGGVRNHIATPIIMNMYDVKECVNIFSRPKDFKKFTTKDKLTNIIQVLNRMIEIMVFELSKTDEQLINQLAKHSNTKVTNIFIPSILDSPYDISIEKQYELFELGKIYAKQNGF